MFTQPLPTSIRIGPYDLEVQHWSSSEAMMKGAIGEMSLYEGYIKVDESLSPLPAAVSYLQGIVRSIWNTAGLSFEATQDAVAQALSVGLIQMWRDNPDTVDWICQQVNTADEPWLKRQMLEDQRRAA